ncbi:hypothetical protein [Streptomyces sp. NPDC057302]|uniref:hypothetical protein n=1 Tax=Streptomyces sp. NPDC057302 TaxID=3346094 RepID=UPI0036399B03
MPGGRNLRGERLRLARRRPSPDRVRARVRDGGEQSRGGRLRRIDWATWGTVAGVIAGIGTLLFTAIATYYGAAVSKDQLDQSREDAARQTRDQASQVAAWTEIDSENEFTVHLRNRSQDPVESVRLVFWAYVEPAVGVGHVDVVQFEQTMSVIGPCSDMIVEEKALRYSKTVRADLGKLPDNPGVEVKYVEFMDRDGGYWVRAPGSGLDQMDPRSTYGVLEKADPGVKVLPGLITGDPAFRAASGCVGDSR